MTLAVLPSHLLAMHFVPTNGALFLTVAGSTRVAITRVLAAHLGQRSASTPCVRCTTSADGCDPMNPCIDGSCAQQTPE
jgi:hypothetical protein